MNPGLRKGLLPKPNPHVRRSLKNRKNGRRVGNDDRRLGVPDDLCRPHETFAFDRDDAVAVHLCV